MSGKKEKWKVIAKDANSPLLRNKIWVDSLGLWPDLFDLPTPKLGIVSRNDQIEYVAVTSTWKKAGEVFFQRIRQTPKVLEEAIEKSVAWGEELNRFTQTFFDSSLESATAEELVAYYKKFAELQSREYACGVLLPLLDVENPFMETELSAFLKSKLEGAKLDDAYATFTYPAFDSVAQEQEKSLLSLYAELLKKPGLAQIISKESPQQALEYLKRTHPLEFGKLSSHAKKYCWVYYVYSGPAYTEQEFMEFISDYARRSVDPLRELEEKKRKREENEGKKRKYLEELKPDEFNAEILRLTPLVVWAKPRRKDYQSKSYYHAEKLMREIARRLSITLDQARSAPIEMLENALENGGKVNESKLREIKRIHACIPTDIYGTMILIGNEASEFVLEQVEEKAGASEAAEIKGTCASGGTPVRGTVKIINSPDQLGKMNYGDVLVSVATTPSIVTAMKKAAAIVTDQGGLTCHAAIVSRELGVPCVVGTKIATASLKDGDLVEVDAMKGIVRKLENSG